MPGGAHDRRLRCVLGDDTSTCRCVLSFFGQDYRENRGETVPGCDFLQAGVKQRARKAQEQSTAGGEPACLCAPRTTGRETGADRPASLVAAQVIPDEWSPRRWFGGGVPSSMAHRPEIRLNLGLPVEPKQRPVSRLSWLSCLSSDDGHAPHVGPANMPKPATKASMPPYRHHRRPCPPLMALCLACELRPHRKMAGEATDRTSQI